MKEVFDQWSIGGTIDAKDLKQILKAMNIQLDKRELQNMLSRAVDGRFDFERFKRILSSF